MVLHCGTHLGPTGGRYDSIDGVICLVGMRTSGSEAETITPQQFGDMMRSETERSIKEWRFVPTVNSNTDTPMLSALYR